MCLALSGSVPSIVAVAVVRQEKSAVAKFNTNMNCLLLQNSNWEWINNKINLLLLKDTLSNSNNTPPPPTSPCKHPQNVTNIRRSACLVCLQSLGAEAAIAICPSKPGPGDLLNSNCDVTVPRSCLSLTRQLHYSIRLGSTSSHGHLSHSTHSQVQHRRRCNSLFFFFFGSIASSEFYCKALSRSIQILPITSN